LQFKRQTDGNATPCAMQMCKIVSQSHAKRMLFISTRQFIHDVQSCQTCLTVTHYANTTKRLSSIVSPVTETWTQFIAKVQHMTWTYCQIIS